MVVGLWFSTAAVGLKSASLVANGVFSAVGLAGIHGVVESSDQCISGWGLQRFLCLKTCLAKGTDMCHIRRWCHVEACCVTKSQFSSMASLVWCVQLPSHLTFFFLVLMSGSLLKPCRRVSLVIQVMSLFGSVSLSRGLLSWFPNPVLGGGDWRNRGWRLSMCSPLSYSYTSRSAISHFC